MDLGFSSRTILSADKRYFFLEDEENETDGYDAPHALIKVFEQAINNGFEYTLGTDKDPRWWLMPAKLLTFITETENCE